MVIPETGNYTFATTSDDGSTLTIDGFQVVDNGGNHVPLTKTGQIRLPRGPHSFTLEYFQSGGGYEIGWQWAREGAALTPVPSWATWTRPAGRVRTVACASLAHSHWRAWQHWSPRRSGRSAEDVDGRGASCNRTGRCC